MHKKEEPVRPIVSSINSLTSGAENYLVKILSKFKNHCKYTVNSVKQFKEYFQKTKINYDHNLYSIASIDAVSLYPSVNIKKVIDYIIDIIYKQPKKYFDDPVYTEGSDIRIPFPPKDKFKHFLKEILLKFNCFTSLAGCYRQISGCSMGSRLSPILANIYVHLMEESIIKNS